MMYICAALISIMVIQTIQMTLSPAALRAVAALQNQRALAMANALRARAHYNVALARTNLGLLDRRVVRNSDNQLENEELDYQEDIPLIEDDVDDEFPDEDYEELLQTGSEENPRPISFTPSEEETNLGSQRVFNGDQEGSGPEMSCPFLENAHTEESLLGSPINVNGLYQAVNVVGIKNDGMPNSGPTSGNPGVGCQSPSEESLKEHDQKLINQILGAQQPFPPGMTTGQPQFPQQILVPLPYLPQGVQPMPFLPQGNYPMAPMAPYQPGYGPRMFLVGQKFQQEQTEHNLDDVVKSTQQTEDSLKEPEPHLHPFTHTHSHTHTYSRGFQEPFQAIPNTQVVTPGVNVHVVQNQNAEVRPSATVQPGFSASGGRTLVQINPDGSVYRPVPPPAFISSNTRYVPGQSGIRIDHRPSNTFTQSQSIHAPNGNMGGNSFAQSQAIVQSGASGSGIIGAEPTQEPMGDSENELGLANGRNEDNQKVGTFMSDFTMKAPESPENFDPKRPQNLQPVVNYIEGQHDNMRRMLQSIERNENLVDHFGVPSDSYREFEFVRSPNQFKYTRTNQFGDEMLGSYPLDNFQIRPVPTLPENFLEESPEEQQESIKNYLEEEKRNVEDILEQVDENNRHNLESLSNLIETNSGILPDSLNFPITSDNELKEDDNINENGLDLTGSPMHKMEFNDEELNDMLLSRFLKNDDGPVESEFNEIPSTDSYLGNIINLPMNEESGWLRFGRSLNKTSTEKLDKLLKAEREVINQLKKDAKHDEDLMMIGYIGENIIKDLEERKNGTKRNKRDIGGTNLPINRLIADPRTRLDLPKTLDNLGAIAKNSFEHENAPLYHVRNMVGSAQDAMLATMKIPTKNFLIPSQYDIVNRQENDLIADINPNFFPRSNFQEPHPKHPFANTFQMVGSAIRGGVLSGQEALGHVGEAANHAKSAMHSTKYVAPRLSLKQVPGVTDELRKKAILIAPRIFDLTREDGRLGQHLDTSQGQFVKVGNILEAVGISKPNLNEVAFEKITMEPGGPLGASHTIRPSEKLKNFLRNIRIEQFNEIQEENGENLGSTINTLQNVRETLGVGSLKEFFTTMKEDLKQFFSESQTQRIPKNQTEMDHTRPQVDKNQDIVAASLIPEYLAHPFMGQVPEVEVDRIWKETNGQNSKGNQKDESLGRILGSVNPMVFERIFNESVRSSNVETPFSVYHHHHDGLSHGLHETGEEVGTNMKLSEQMLKPFMGQANDRLKHDFFRKYMPEDSKSGSEESREFDRGVEVIDIENEGNGLDYEE